jgi:hypothetical protein
MPIHSKFNKRLSQITKFSIAFLSIFYTYWFCWNYIAQENYLYYFDFGIHYAEYIRVHDLLIKTGIFPTLANVLNSIRTEDYNLLSALLLSPFSIISTSRWSYIFATITLFYVPSYILYFKIIKLFTPKLNPLLFLSLSSILTFSPTLITPILRNESSIDGTIFILLILYITIKHLCTKKNFEKNHKLHIYFTLGILLSIPPLLHRWYLFFTASFLIVFIILDIYIIFSAPQKNIVKKLLITFGNQSLLALTTVISFISISQNLWKKFIFADYQKLYSNFKIHNNPILSINEIMSKIGYVIIIILIFYLLNLYSSKQRRVSLLLFTLVTVTISLFLKLQDFNVHHYYLIIYPILLIIGIGTSVNYKKNPIIALILIPLLFLNLYVATNINIRRLIISTMFSQQYSSPINYSETNNINHILDNLKILKPNSVYIASFSEYFNSSGILNYCCYFNKTYESLCPHITQSIFYLSDSLPDNFRAADYILVLNDNTIDPLRSPSRLLKEFIYKHPNNYQYQKTFILSQQASVSLFHTVTQAQQTDFDTLYSTWSRP